MANRLNSNPTKPRFQSLNSESGISVCREMQTEKLTFAKIGLLNREKYVYQLGFWSAIAATVLLTVASPTATAAIQPFATIIGFLLTTSFLIVVACIHCYAPEET